MAEVAAAAVAVATHQKILVAVAADAAAVVGEVAFGPLAHC